MNRLVALVVAFALAGCAVTQPVVPKYDLPPGAANAAQNELLQRWWTVFNDTVLNALVDEAIASNLDLKAALARIEAARSQVLLAQSYLMPSVDLAGNANRSRISAETSPPLPFAITCCARSRCNPFDSLCARSWLATFEQPLDLFGASTPDVRM